jgi:all-trans-retinol dehydrogenase (NAD+)
MAYFMNKENWKKPKFWILIAIFLRVAYVFMNERGWNPFKKNITGDHVFLTGAGGGIGRLMAIRLGLLGCKLSLSDINMTNLEATKTILVE